MKLFFVFLSVIILNFHVSAQEKWTDFILPVSLVAIGSYGVNSSSFHSLNSDIKDIMEDLRDGDYMNFDDYLQYFPAISSLFLEYTGVPSEYNVSQRLLLTLTSVVILRASVTLTKDNVAEKRPDFSAKTSFPSGHTATAFMGAELIRQ
ncbi:MAG: hypothetical protein IJ748_00550 [Bacteroidales bacterium]|nr:hypothetical protein [Bacteroidales bacterium]